MSTEVPDGFHEFIEGCTNAELVAMLGDAKSVGDEQTSQAVLDVLKNRKPEGGER